MEKDKLSPLIGIYMRVRIRNDIDNPTFYVDNLRISTDAVFKDNSYMFMKHIRGSAA